jgi:DNA ligase (NAD+)
MNRSKAQELVEQLGGKAASGVSKTLTYLVTNDKDSGSSKNRKAAELGVKVIDEMEFYDIIKYDPKTKRQTVEISGDSVADL